MDFIKSHFENDTQKGEQICCKSVQLVRGSSFRNDLLQNPYFTKYFVIVILILKYSRLRKKFLFLTNTEFFQLRNIGEKISDNM